MPIRPSDALNPREIAAAYQVEQQIVSLDEPTRSAIFDIGSKFPITFAFGDINTRDRDPVPEVNIDRAAMLFNRAQVA
jgi:hypothetical protein